MSLLSKIESVLSAGHKDAIKKVFQIFKKSTPDATGREIEFKAKNLVDRIKSASENRVFDSILAVGGEKVSSEDHNTNLENAFIDLNAIYSETENISTIQTQQTASLADDYSKAKSAILKLINDARVFTIRSRYPQFDDIKLVDFNIARNTSLNSPIALVDPDTRLLKLPHILKRRNHLARRGVRTTKVTAETIADGQAGQIGRQFPPENVVDANPETFWADIVYADTVFQNTYNRYAPDEDGVLVNVVDGPIVKLTLNFSNAEAVNQIKLLPFSDFPVTVLEISYRNASNSLIRTAIPEFKVEKTLDWVEYNFETVFTTDIEVVLAQENYRNLVMRVPKSVLFSTDFFLRLIEDRGKELKNVPVDLSAGSEIYDDAVADLASLMGQKDFEKSPVHEIDLTGKTILSIGESFAAFDPSLQQLLEDVSSYTDALPKEFRQEIETFNKVEYVVGARSVEANYVVYSPLGHYESDKFQPAASVTNVELQVDEHHPEFQSQYGEYRRTSTEWAIELAEDRIVPIFPSNHIEDGFLKVKNELLKLSNSTLSGTSRFPSYLNYVLVRENDQVLTDGVDYTATWNGTQQGKLTIDINEGVFNNGKVYTIDYFAAPGSEVIDVLTKFNDKKVATPDTFDSTGPDDEVELSLTPYINYGIINSDDFLYDDIDQGYQYIAPTGAYKTGLVRVTPTWKTDAGATIVGLTGTSTVTGRRDTNGNFPDWNSLHGDYFLTPYAYYLKLTNVPGATYEVKEVTASGNITLTETPLLATGLVGDEIAASEFFGNITGTVSSGPLTGIIDVPYSLEVVYQDGEQVFGFDNLLYKPITVLIGGTEAENITDYENLEQPAFAITSSNDGEYQYIHDGNKLYFNQPISTEILVDYRWITKYVKARCDLIANKPITPTVTPTIDEYRILLNTTIL